ncbi:Hypothetical protein R9X50_00781600 [Acrodontium crateriforme]|uniref:HMG box domain-containing protein n=1 Tax=Acrodontium crateriforme TaxID=150365 RepID=A0AAQ3RB13_9PEZI|nr:Hypothetical protein R9X50_00781600 [Acrodontium crateriforme]
MAHPAKKAITIDTNEFVRTRDALASAYMSLSASIDKTVKAYLDHTNAVLAGEGTLNIAHLSQPFHQLTATVQQVLQGAAPLAVATPAADPTEEPAEDGKKKKRNYKPRDPNAPKRPLTAYFQFLKVHRPQVAADMLAANGGVAAKPGDISTEATNRWNQLDDKQKQVWKDMYNEEMSGYEERSRAYKISIGAPLDEDDPVKMEKKAIAKAKRDAKKAEASAGSAIADAAPAGDDDSSDSDSSSDEDEDIDEPVAPPPKATPAAVKKTPKSAIKKAVPPTPQFSSINNNATTTATPSAAVPTSSPERKRKVAAASVEGEPKKRGRKSNAEKAAEQLAAEMVTPAKAVSSAGEGKREKKPRKKKGEV